MEILIDKKEDYTLSCATSQYYLNVTCGTTAVYTITFQLNEMEIATFLERGEAFLDDLAWRVRDYPEEYLERSV